MEAAERPRLLLIPYIYKQDRHKEKNCREIWTHGLKERVRRRNKIKEKEEEKMMENSPKNAHLKGDLTFYNLSLGFRDFQRRRKQTNVASW